MMAHSRYRIMAVAIALALGGCSTRVVPDGPDDAFDASANPDGQNADDSSDQLHFDVADATAPSTRVLAVGRSHICATRDGALYCWGANESAQCGADHSPTVAPFHVVDDVIDACGGYLHSCAVTGRGEAFCWGASGELRGDSTPGPAGFYPVPVLSDVSRVACGAAFTCALLRDSTMRCWGANRNGELGLPESTTSSLPIDGPRLSGVARMAVGASHACALRVDGSLWCWGANSSGQVGAESLDDVVTPRRVELSGRAIEVTLGAYHTCALVDGGALYCWGGNQAGALDPDPQRPRSARNPLPVRVALPGNVDEVAAGALHTCVLSSGTIRCWGDDSVGQSAGGSVITPHGGAVFNSLTAGSNDSCVFSDDNLECWGDGRSGQLLNGGMPSPRPTPVNFAP